VKPVAQRLETPDASFDGGDLDCGSGLLLLIRKHQAYRSA
jgi:5-methyltetrahydropteroyltriglutamate--homocysteine methyltransferase